MGREDGGRILAELLGHAVAIALDLRGGGGDGPIEPLQLVFHGVTRQEPTRDAEPLVVHDKHFADRHAGRYGNPLKTFHVVSNERTGHSTSASRSARHARRFLRIERRLRVAPRSDLTRLAPRRRLCRSPRPSRRELRSTVAERCDAVASSTGH